MECSSWHLQFRFDDQFGAAPVSADLSFATRHRDRRFATGRVISECEQLLVVISPDDEHRLDQRRLTMFNLYEQFLRRRAAERALIEIQPPQSGKVWRRHSRS